MTYNPKIYEGEHAQDIFSEVLFGNRTMSRNLVRVLDNVKGSQNVTSLSGDITFTASVDHITESYIASATSTLAFKDARVAPAQLMAFDTFSMSDLRNSRFNKDMAPGASNLGSNEFERAVLSYVLPRLGKSYESISYNGITAATKTAIAASSATTTQKAWAAAQTAGLVDGVIAKAILSGAVQGVAGTNVTSSNIVTEYTKIVNAADPEVSSHLETKLLVPEADRMLIIQANLAAAYRDVFAVSNMGTEQEAVTFMGIPVEFSGIGARLLGRAGERGDIILATDLMSDLNSATIDKINPASPNKLFFRLDCTLDTAVLVPQQKVLYL